MHIVSKYGIKFHNLTKNDHMIMIEDFLEAQILGVHHEKMKFGKLSISGGLGQNDHNWNLV